MTGRVAGSTVRHPHPLLLEEAGHGFEFRLDSPESARAERVERVDARSVLVRVGPDAGRLAVDEHDRIAIAGQANPNWRVHMLLDVGMHEPPPAIRRVTHRVRIPLWQQLHSSTQLLNAIELGFVAGMKEQPVADVDGSMGLKRSSGGCLCDAGPPREIDDARWAVRA